MKIKQTFSSIQLCILTLMLSTATINAQVVGPSFNETLVASTGCMPVGPVINWMDNAVMQYNTGAGDFLMAVGWGNFQGPGYCSGVEFSEDAGANWTNMPYDPTGVFPGITNPDEPNVLIAGPFSGNTYFMGVVYIAFDPAISNKSIFIDVYKITNPGTPSGWTHMCTRRISNTGVTNMGADMLRADIITKDVSGTLVADDFVIGWRDHSIQVSSSPGISLAYGSLSSIAASCNAATVNTYTTLNFTNNTAAQSFDIAGYEGNGSDYTVITWVTPRGRLFVAESAANTSTLVAAPTNIDNQTVPGQPIVNPRVDAMDPYTTNQNYGTSYYNIAYTKYTTTVLDMKVYNVAAGAYVASATLPGFNWNPNGIPVVACGPNTTDQYSVAYTASNSILGGNDLILQTVDASTGGLYSTNYYQVNNITTPVLARAIAISNDWVQNSPPEPSSNLVSWIEDGSNNIYFKLTSSATTPSFKSTTVGTTKAGIQSFGLSPNPTKDVLNITGLNADAEYMVTDITGRTVMNGTIKTSSAQVQTNSLAPGMYLLNIDGKEKMKFVKD